MNHYNPYQFGAYQQPVQRFGQFQCNYIPQAQNTQTGQQMPMQSTPQQVGAMLRLVSSIEELAAAQIPFDGSTSWFYNTAADTIHSKTFDFGTGKAPITTYVREQPVPVVQYATMEDIENLRREIEALRIKKAVKKNEQPDVPNE